MAATDYYATLGLDRTATDADVKKAFRKLAQKWHPDVSEDPAAAERFKELNEAYQVLSDPDRRQRYDLFGAAGVEADVAAGFGGFADIFDAFFGGAAGGARRGRPPTGSDMRYDLRITFEEAVLGTEKEIEFPILGRCDTCGGSGAKPGTQATTCPQCQGRGEVRAVRQTMLGQMINVTACPKCRGEGRIVETPCETCKGEGRTERRRSLRVSIPAGIDEGHQIRLSNEGEAGLRGGPPGSLYVAVHVAPHPALRREGTELVFEARIGLAQAALGTRIEVPTVEGHEEVEIKAGTQPGTEIRLRGKGVPHLRRGGSRGDLHVVVDIAVPTRLTRAERDALEAYARAADEPISDGTTLLERVRDKLA
ncbi:MAG TPA: molecular chaperone DnaJ [Candidatus Acidoferrales bacterium]|jgi:molecular chaperone DnaJ|nr:molecular chaperone DnaJ [Candidatus Acidoferrales bacterium]